MKRGKTRRYSINPKLYKMKIKNQNHRQETKSDTSVIQSGSNSSPANKMKEEIEKLQREVDMLRIKDQEEGGDEFVYPCEFELIELKAELKGYQTAKQEVIEMIDKLENKHNTWKDMDEKLRQSDRIGVLEELKKSLNSSDSSPDKSLGGEE